MAVYVCSDIHGLREKYDALLENIDLDQDTLMILGDVIDRGPDGYFILIIQFFHHFFHGRLKL